MGPTILISSNPSASSRCENGSLRSGLPHFTSGESEAKREWLAPGPVASVEAGGEMSGRNQTKIGLPSAGLGHPCQAAGHRRDLPISPGIEVEPRCWEHCIPEVGSHLSPSTGSRGTTAGSSGDALGKALASVRLGARRVAGTAGPVTKRGQHLSGCLVALYPHSHCRSTHRIIQAITSHPAPRPPWVPPRAWQVCVGCWGRGGCVWCLQPGVGREGSGCIMG